MVNSWFRMYGEFATDPKVQMLSEADQRRLTMLFCLRCNGNVTLHDDEVTFLLRISNDEWQATKAIFIAKNFINHNNEITNWDRRQFISDSSKNRVAAYRAKKKLNESSSYENESNKESYSNGDVTLQETKSNAVDTDTDTYKNLKTIVRKESARFSEFWDSYPKTSRKVAKASCLKKWKARNLDSIADQIIAHVKAMALTKTWQSGFEPAPLTYINQSRWDDEIITSATSEYKQIWFLTATGIEAKGAELNMPMQKNEIFPDYRLRVFKAAGLTPDEFRKAKVDYEARK